MSNQYIGNGLLATMLYFNVIGLLILGIFGDHSFKKLNDDQQIKTTKELSTVVIIVILHMIITNN